MNVGLIVQARMSSQRLPGKVLYPVAGKPMLQYLLERLGRCQGVDNIVVATSVDQSDTPIAEFCQQHGLACHRGSLLNVAGRFKEVLETFQFDSFVRVNGDSPLLDYRLIEFALDIFCQNDFDLVTNVLPRTFPKGQSVEVVRGTTFKSAYALMQADEELEHVTQYFYKNRANFKIFNFTSPQPYADVQLSVDSPQDMETFAAMVAAMNRPHWEYSLEDILQLYWHVTQPVRKGEAQA